MKLKYEGKTKDVYELADGNILFKLKDDATGTDGKFDPGANEVALQIKGLGKQSLRMSKYFFEKIEAAGIPTQFVDCDIDQVTMTVKPVEMFGNALGEGIELVCRYRAVGSFVRRYGGFINEGAPLDALVEVMIKDDKRGDPPITKDILIELGIMSADEYEELKNLTKKISGIIRDEFAHKGLELYDIKLEFGRYKGEIILIDEISGGTVRVYKDGVCLEPMEISPLILGVDK